MRFMIFTVLLSIMFLLGFVTGRSATLEQAETIRKQKVEIRTVEFGIETITAFLEISERGVTIAEQCYESKNVVLPRPITIDK